MKNARELCLSALIRMEKDEAYSNIILNSLLEKSQLLREEKAFATRLFYGVLEKKLLLDYNISLLSKRPLKKLDAEVLCILRLGLYQLLFLDSVPDSAAVNESVKLCDFAKKNSAKALVNALLRTKIRQDKEIFTPKADDTSALSVCLSADESIVSLFLKQYGLEETEQIFAAFSKETRQYIRINTRKTGFDALSKLLSEKHIFIENLEGVEGCAVIKNSGDLSHLKEFQQGLFYVQDLASQQCCAALEPQNASRILDVCAAPGGKSFTLALLADKNTEVVCCDVSQNRVSLIKKGKERLELSNIIPKINDAQIFNSELGRFDRILCDVPCSGLGVIGKKPEIRYKKIVPEALFSLQYDILQTSAKYLDNGGILVYSTCTLNKRENEDVVFKFLSEYSEFEPYPLPFAENGEFYKTFLPNRDGCDGFFVAAIRKKS